LRSVPLTLNDLNDIERSYNGIFCNLVRILKTVAKIDGAIDPLFVGKCCNKINPATPTYDLITLARLLEENMTYETLSNNIWADYMIKVFELVHRVGSHTPNFVANLQKVLEMDNFNPNRKFNLLQAISPWT